MAETVHLTLKGAKQGDIKGDSTQTSLGREGSIECIYYEQGITSTYDPATGTATGRLMYTPLLIRKLVDSSSPLLIQAMVSNETVEGVFKFFRPDPSGDGTTQQYYTVDFKQGRIVSFKQYVPDTTEPDTANDQPMDEVSFVFGTMHWANNVASKEATDQWGANK